MELDFGKLLAAERRGRMAASLCCPESGQEWMLRPGPEPDDNAGLFALARWLDRFGAGVSLLVPPDSAVSPEGELLLAACNALGLCREAQNGLKICGMPDENADSRPQTPMIRQPSGKGIDIKTLPDDMEAWREKLRLESGNRFVRPCSPATPQLSAHEIRKIDAKAINLYRVPGVCLMENAAIGLVQAASSMLKDVSKSAPAVLVIAGGGNNGGDGLAAARGLAAIGLKAVVVLLVNPAKLQGDAKINYRLLSESGNCEIDVIAGNDVGLEKRITEADLILDAMLGTGFHGKLQPAFARAVEMVNASSLDVLAADVPSGLDCDMGTAEGQAIKARVTVTFGAAKKGFFRGPESWRAGKVLIADIGAPNGAYPAC